LKKKKVFKLIGLSALFRFPLDGLPVKKDIFPLLRAQRAQPAQLANPEGDLLFLK
jgi:hypothetical protein